ncbi:DUF1822 family protein [Nostocaceae cyanobacterium CENA369]|uniref:DUF1822 family protein n=1 Tax=Dendronalium phyllosphericum CENA369 TaxID=1725256 RepID=A0A8J7LDD5_9NOST|nr:DUF1822 family protein [Dendronalium phyllosphericum]MBH8571888.1 DUF1822 family protein [Dendronalium phyllosphericum CENA369]
MINTTDKLDDSALILPISQMARLTARQFANQQPTLEKAEQVQLNTLAVFVVNDYLQMMEIPTDLKASDSWNPVMRLCANVADLHVPSIGRLECRSVRLHEQVCSMPPETWEERVGYVVVQVDEPFQEAKLLGFVNNIATEVLPLSQLQPLEALIDYLGELRTCPTNALVNLSQWFTNQFEAGWQTVESLWNSLSARPAYVFRSPITLEETPLNQPEITRRAKLIDLGIQIVDKPVMLVVEISPEADRQTSIRLQLHSTGNQIYLPPGVQLIVLDGEGTVFLEAQARSADNYIQLQFRGEIQERFSVRVSLDDMSITEHFVI